MFPALCTKINCVSPGKISNYDPNNTKSFTNGEFLAERRQKLLIFKLVIARYASSDEHKMTENICQFNGPYTFSNS